MAEGLAMTALMLKFLALLLGFALWAALAYLKMVPVEPLVALLQMGLGGLVTHMLQDSGAPAVSAFAPATPAAPVAPSGQGGFASVRLLSTVAVIALGLSMLGGCTTTTGSMYAGLATQAEAGIKVFDDNSLATVRTVLCAQPYSAIQRHPELQPGIQAMCGPLANSSSLDAGQLAMLMNILQSSGVKLQAQPAAAAASGAK
jgi:hypothetical protein